MAETKRKIIKETIPGFKEIKKEEKEPELDEDIENEDFEGVSEIGFDKSSRASPTLQASGRQERIEDIVGIEPRKSEENAEPGQVYNVPSYDSSYGSKKYVDQEEFARNRRESVEERGLTPEKTFNFDRFSREMMQSMTGVAQDKQDMQDVKQYREERVDSLASERRLPFRRAKKI